MGSMAKFGTSLDIQVSVRQIIEQSLRIEKLIYYLLDFLCCFGCLFKSLTFVYFKYVFNK